jgi:uncharacterized protein (DUF983 family)
MTTKQQIIARGLKGRCPNCGEPTLFPTGSLKINARCPRCDTALNRGEGFFLGPMVVNYTIAVFIFAVPCVLLGLLGVVPWNVAIALAALSCTLLPVLLYRRTWSWWLMLYFYFLPDRLPSNGGPRGAEEED